MKKWILNNWPLKLAGLVAAIVIWIIVAIGNDPTITKSFDIPVEFINSNVIAERNMVVVANDTTVRIRVKSQRSIVSALTEADFKATADFEKMYRDTQVPVVIETLNANVSNDDIEQINYSVEVNLEELETITKVVETEATGKPETGYAVGEITASPSSVSITCPKSMAAYINTVKAVVNVDKLNADAKVSAELVVYDGNNQKIDLQNSNITLGGNGIVECSVKILSIQTVSVVVDVVDENKIAPGHKLSGIEVSPDKVTIAGPKEALADLAQIKLTDISLAGLDKSTEKTVDIRSYLPEGVTLYGDKSDIAIMIKID